LPSDVVEAAVNEPRGKIADAKVATKIGPVTCFGGEPRGSRAESFVV